MRLHRLRLQAFGPFAGSEEVDFDALTAGGLFLMHGPTGAGKTSVLDAVCFALYGRVPGARADGAARLRSDHAAAGSTPQVCCEFSLAGRRFEVTRSPSWERPKKRGSGITTEQARTLLRERVDGQWVPRSSRNDEASQLLTEVLGMGLEQFTKVVLLPQGEFAAFLRCGAEERRPLLQRLFGTDRFARVEGWLAEERRRLGRQVEEADTALSRLVARGHQCVAGLPLPEDALHPHDIVPERDPVTHLDALARPVAALLEARAQAHAAASAWRHEVSGRRDRTRRHAEDAARLHAARTRLADLDREAADIARCRQELDAARRAESVAGELRLVADATADVEAAETELVRRRRDADGVLLDLPDGGVTTSIEPVAGTLRAACDELARLEALALEESELRALRAQTARLEDDARATASAVTEVSEEVERNLRDRDATRADLDGLASSAADLASARQSVDAATVIHQAAVAADAVAGELATASQAAAQATTCALELKETWLDLRQRRLDGMAAELADRLRAGHECPVCGSLDHPAPAAPVSGPVSAEDEEVARDRVEVADHGRAAAEEVLAGLRERHAGLLAQSAGTDPATAATDLRAARARLTRAQQAADASTLADRRLAELTTAVDDGHRRRAELSQRLSGTTAALEGMRARGDALAARLAAALGEDRQVADRRKRLRARVDAAEGLLAALEAHHHADAVRTQAAAAASRACAGAGFTSPAEAAAAARDPDFVAALEARVGSHQERLVAVRALLAEPELVAAAGAGGDPALLAEQAAELDRLVREADERYEATAGDLALARRARTALEDLRLHAAADAAAAAPVRARAALVAELARCADGTGGDNALRMRLSAYVLAARLEQVAEAATVRLTRMSGGRYSLVHSDAAERRGARSGLGLRVVDGWTGIERDTCTLSGGESFLASLALALGLADVVHAESGGASIETLFVDEGFGTLDEDTLEEVMATLDGLREGGRAVGLVSHVPEMRSRIPSRLEVVKTRSGSHLRALDGREVGAA